MNSTDELFVSYLMENSFSKENLNDTQQMLLTMIGVSSHFAPSFVLSQKKLICYASFSISFDSFFASSTGLENEKKQLQVC